MTDSIVGFFQSLSMSDGLIAFLISMFPIVELRGAIPVALLVFDMNPWLAYVLCVLGNMLPVPFILWLTRPLFEWLRHTKLLGRFMNWVHRHAMKRADKVTKYEVLGLFLFVAIPLPGTGAWTGSLIAAFLNMNPRRSFVSVLLGVMTAGVIMTFGSSIVTFIAGLF